MHLDTNFDWGRFFRLYRPAALRFASGLSGGRGDAAEDAVQEAARALFERVRDGRVALESAAHARNYFFRSVHNLCVSERRSAGRGPRRVASTDEVEPADEGPGPEEAAWERETGDRDRERTALLRDVIAGLKESERDALRLRFDAGLTFKEMSQRTGIPLSTLQARVEAGLAKIRKRIGKPGSGA